MPILQERKITLDCSQKSSFSIGRKPGSDICLPHPTVSDHHAELRYLVSAGQKVSLFLKDNKSKYGVYVEGHRIPSTFVSANSHIQISVFQLVVTLNGSSIEVRILQTEEQYTLECHKLSYFAGKRPLVDNVDLVVRPGDFVGLFGPSGSGKTSLLRLLTGCYRAKSGSISLGGMEYQKHFDLLKNFIAYIPQEDILYPNLTVRETLEYAGKLRLPQDVSHSQLNDYLDQTLTQLDLTAVQHQEVATLSGGQKKRVNIATELITQPRILVADEPDAGLDPHIQDQMMDVFRAQADAGNAVIMTTHTMENFFRFDYVAIINKGCLCYYGPPEKALAFFGGTHKLTAPLQIYRQLNSDADRPNSPLASGKHYPARYLDSPDYREYFTNRALGISQWAAADDERAAKRVIGDLVSVVRSFNAATFRQLLILAHRHLSLRVGGLKNLAIYLLIPVIIAMVLAAQKVKAPEELRGMRESQQALEDAISKPVPQSATTATPAASGVKPVVLTARQQKMLLTPKFPHVVPLTLVLTAIFCGTFIACAEISHERQLFAREHQLSVGIPNYLFSKIPFLFGITFIQMSLLMVLVTLLHNVDNIAFTECVTILTLTSWASVTVGLFLSALDRTGRNSFLMSIGVILPQIIFSGAIGPDFYSGMNRGAKIFADLCISRWGFEGMLRAMNDATIIGWGPAIVNHQVGFPHHEALYGINNFFLYGIFGAVTIIFLFLCAITLKAQDR